jgi:hypothetical protein
MIGFVLQRKDGLLTTLWQSILDCRFFDVGCEMSDVGFMIVSFLASAGKSEIANP